MNPLWLARNIKGCWQNAATTADFFNELGWLYAHKLLGDVTSKEWKIAFRYPKPIGDIDLTVRSNGGADAFIHGEVFHHHYYDLRLGSEPETILDLGANIGLTTAYLGRLYPKARIACVEPMPSNARLLRQNLEANKIDAVVYQAAVDTADGEVRMAVHDKDFGHQVADNGEVGRSTIATRAISVPTIMRELGWDRIGLLKVDIEGHEKALFAKDCDWLDRVDVMCIECHDGYYSPDDLRELAKRFGFSQPELRPGIWLVRR